MRGKQGSVTWHHLRFKLFPFHCFWVHQRREREWNRALNIVMDQACVTSTPSHWPKCFPWHMLPCTMERLASAIYLWAQEEKKPVQGPVRQQVPSQLSYLVALQLSKSFFICKRVFLSQNCFLTENSKHHQTIEIKKKIVFRIVTCGEDHFSFYS